MQETKPLSGREYAALQSLFAAVSHMQALMPTLEKRAKMVPNLWRDMCLVSKLVDRITEQIVTTVPLEKLRHVSADIRNTQLYVKVEPPGLHSIGVEGFSYTPTKVLNQLLGYVCEHDCILCDRTPVEARKCPVRKMLDGALPHEIRAKDGEHCKYSDMTLGMETEDEAG